MPWDSQSFRKHNKSLTTAQSGKAAKIANAVLERTGDEGMAIAVANKNAKAKKLARRGLISDKQAAKRGL